MTSENEKFQKPADAGKQTLIQQTVISTDKKIQSREFIESGGDPIVEYTTLLQRIIDIESQQSEETNPASKEYIHLIQDVESRREENQGYIKALRQILGASVMHIAVFLNDPDSIKTLITAGADPNAVDNSKDTPLHVAMSYGIKNSAKALIDARANPNMQNDKMLTPLHIAVRNNDLESTQALVTAGARIDAKDATGSTPLHLAVTINNIELFGILIESGQALNTQDSKGTTALLWAVRLKNLDFVKIKSIDAKQSQKY